MNSKSHLKNDEELPKFDKTHLIIMVEILQYTIIFLMLSVIASIVWNNINVLLNTRIHNKELRHKPRYMQFLMVFSSLILQTFLMTIIVFYIKILGFMVPPIGPHLNKNYVKGSSYEPIVHISIFIVLVELVPMYRKTIEQLHEITKFK